MFPTQQCCILKLNTLTETSDTHMLYLYKYTYKNNTFCLLQPKKMKDEGSKEDLTISGIDVPELPAMPSMPRLNQVSSVEHI